MKTINYKINKCFTSQYCSLISDDGIESATLSFNERGLKELLLKARKASESLGFTVILKIEDSNVVEFKFDKDPQFHRMDGIYLNTRFGCVEVKTSSKHDSEDNFSVEFFIE